MRRGSSARLEQSLHKRKVESSILSPGKRILIKMKKSIKSIKIGHSPDPDDAYMFYGLSKGKVSLDGYRIEHVVRDIQSLNVLAMKGRLGITAISAAVYPLLNDKYWILSTGASVGRNYGPIVVARENIKIAALKNKRIAMPGHYTTAHLLSRIFLEPFEPVFMDFTKVMAAVKKGIVEAGVVIHEGQMNYGDSGLAKVCDLGQLWHKKYRLPIPLGLDVVRKDVGRETAQNMNSALRLSIEHAFKHPREAIGYALKFGRGISEDVAQKFVSMYVNKDTLDLGSEGKRALKLLYRLAYEKGIYSANPKIEVIGLS